jgi:hypothetical protein
MKMKTIDSHRLFAARRVMDRVTTEFAAQGLSEEDIVGVFLDAGARRATTLPQETIAAYVVMVTKALTGALNLCPGGDLN